jgi:hypothetical protein
MSDTEVVPTGGARGDDTAPVTAATATATTATVPVRMSLRPSRFTAKSDFNLWFMRFEVY